MAGNTDGLAQAGAKAGNSVWTQGVDFGEGSLLSSFGLYSELGIDFFTLLIFSTNVLPTSNCIIVNCVTQFDSAFVDVLLP